MSTSSGAWRTGHNEVRGFRQFYREWQPATESALPVLALHGSLTQSGMWIALAEDMRSVRMLCPDQRGFGESLLGRRNRTCAHDLWGHAGSGVRLDPGHRLLICSCGSLCPDFLRPGCSPR